MTLHTQGVALGYELLPLRGVQKRSFKLQNYSEKLSNMMKKIRPAPWLQGRFFSLKVYISPHAGGHAKRGCDSRRYRHDELKYQLPIVLA